MLLGSAYSEAHVAAMVLGVMVVGVALLSYFVVAPEYEKRLEKQFAAIAQETNERHHLIVTHQQKQIRKMRSLGAWDVEAVSSSDDDAFDPMCRMSDRVIAAPSSCGSTPTAASVALAATRQAMLRRRRSEGDALRKANIDKAEMLRRRVLLRKLEEEIEGAMKETIAQANIQYGTNSQNDGQSGNGLRRMSNGCVSLSDDRVRMLRDHPADCSQELATLSQTKDTNEIKRALQTVHDVLSLYLSVDHRDLNKVTVFCNSLLKHDGLNRLRAFEVSVDTEIRTLSNSIIEKAVPAIWH